MIIGVLALVMYHLKKRPINTSMPSDKKTSYSDLKAIEDQHISIPDLGATTERLGEIPMYVISIHEGNLIK